MLLGNNIMKPLQAKIVLFGTGNGVLTLDEEEIDLTSDEDFDREFRAPPKSFHSTTVAAGPKNANLEAIGHRRNRHLPKRLKGVDIGKRLGDLAGSGSRVEGGSNRSYLTNVSTFIREIVKLHFTKSCFESILFL